MATFNLRSTVNLGRFKKAFFEEKQRKLGQALQLKASEIVKRTQGGHDIGGGAFKDYDPDYRDWKTGNKKSSAAKKWRKFMSAVGGRSRIPAAGRSGTPDLTLSGRMLGSVQATVTIEGDQIKGKIFVPAGEEAQKARWNMVKRPFFGLSDTQKRAILNQLK